MTTSSAGKVNQTSNTLILHTLERPVGAAILRIFRISAPPDLEKQGEKASPAPCFLIRKYLMGATNCGQHKQITTNFPIGMLATSDFVRI